MHCYRLLLSSLLFIVSCGNVVAQQVAVKGTVAGQGYMFSAGSGCWAVTPFHMLKEREISGELGLSIEIGDQKATAKPPTRGKWYDQDLDVAVLEMKACLTVKPGAALNPPSTDYVLYRQDNGAVDFVVMEVDQQSDSALTVRATTKDCPFKSSRSGSLAIVQGKTFGLVVRAATGQSANCQFANVVPLSAINDFLQSARSFHLPLAPEAPMLMEAAADADEQRFRDLLASIGDPNTKDAQGYVALDVLASAKDGGLYRFANRAGLTKQGGSVSDTACAVWTTTRVRMAKELLRRGASPEGRGGSSWSPLMSAVSAGDRCDNIDMVDTLLEAGADPNHLWVLRPSSGDAMVTSPFMIAVEDGRPETLKHLLSKKANANMVQDSWVGDDLTPLFALAIDARPSENGVLVNFSEPGLDPSCWSTDNAKVAKFRMLLPLTNLSARLGNREDYKTKEYSRMTVKEILEKRLGGGCTYNTCDGSGRTGPGRCLERMLGALQNYQK